MQEFLKIAKDKCMNTKLLGFIGAGVIILAEFFAYAKISLFGFKESVSFISSAGGKIVLLLVLINIALLLKNLYENKLPEKVAKVISNTKMMLIPIALIIITILIANGKIFDGYGLVKPGFGCYLLWIGIVISAAFPFIYKENAPIEIKKED